MVRGALGEDFTENGRGYLPKGVRCLLAAYLRRATLQQARHAGPNSAGAAGPSLASARREGDSSGLPGSRGLAPEAAHRGSTHLGLMEYPGIRRGDADLRQEASASVDLSVRVSWQHSQHRNKQVYRNRSKAVGGQGKGHLSIGLIPSPIASPSQPGCPRAATAQCFAQSATPRRGSSSARRKRIPSRQWADSGFRTNVAISPRLFTAVRLRGGSGRPS